MKRLIMSALIFRLLINLVVATHHQLESFLVGITSGNYERIEI